MVLRIALPRSVSELLYSSRYFTASSPSSSFITLRVIGSISPEEREKWREDHKSSNPKISHGEDLLPCAPEGNREYPDSVYEEIRQIWLSGKNAE